MPAPLLIRSQRHSYSAHLGQNLLPETGRLIHEQTWARPAATCAVITDETVAALYGETLLASLTGAGFRATLLPVMPGETSKSLAQVERLCESLAQARLDRHSFLIALGGGVVGDLAGFVAAVYFRGIPFVQIPTTVVAQVDSSIGGKTGVNLASGKNLVGAFHPPSLVVADVQTLATLPDREFNEGMAEAIKHAVIRDQTLLGALIRLDRRDSGALVAIIHRNLEIKAEIVARDEYETTGERALLNFGHTVGHALENSVGYGQMFHGEAVALGMVAAGRLSIRKAGLPEAQFAEILRALRHFNLPTTLPPGVSAEGALESMARDKKFQDGAIRFVLTPALGQAFLSAPGLVTWEDLRRELLDLHTA